jgi:Ca-activated chloride channel family protein
MNNIEINPSGWVFGESQWLNALWGIIVLALIVLFFSSMKKSALRRFIDISLHESITGKRIAWTGVLRFLFMSSAIIAIVIGLARPQSDPREVEIESKGRDVVFLLDVSRSMLARDVAPNRLERAKLWINDLVDELHGDRVGLVAFAGSSTVVSPLTTDKLFFKLSLEELDTSSVAVGGTNIGDAIRRTMDLVFTNTDEASSGHRDIVLITDGEDQESLPVQAAQVAGDMGIRVIALGIGSRDGTLVPADPNSPTRSDQPVRSSLQSASLTQIAAATPGGVYLEVGTGTIDLAKVYKDLIAAADQKTIETTSTIQFQEQYMVVFAIALVLLLLEMLVLPTRERRKPCAAS